MLARSELPSVRVAHPDDEDEIMEMCRRLHAENGLFTFNDDKVRTCLRQCYDRKGAIVGVIGAAKKIEASICLLISGMYYTDDWHLAELWNFVEADHRRTRNAEALIEYAKKCADTIGIPLITGIITNKQMAEKVRLYRRLLGYPAGAFFVYGAKWQSASEPTAEDFWRPFESRAEKRQRERRETKNGTT